jgi:hypothetical protein
MNFLDKCLSNILFILLYTRKVSSLISACMIWFGMADCEPWYGGVGRCQPQLGLVRTNHRRRYFHSSLKRPITEVFTFSPAWICPDQSQTSLLLLQPGISGPIKYVVSLLLLLRTEMSRPCRPCQKLNYFTPNSKVRNNHKHRYKDWNGKNLFKNAKLVCNMWDKGNIFQIH